MVRHITWVQHPDGTKLFSFHRHDYKTYEADEVSVSIDGGFDYFKGIGEHFTELIEDVIVDIRGHMVWGNNYDKEGKPLSETVHILLKDMDTLHIINVVKYLMEAAGGDTPAQNHPYVPIFLEELKYREELKND